MLVIAIGKETIIIANSAFDKISLIFIVSHQKVYLQTIGPVPLRASG